MKHFIKVLGLINIVFWMLLFANCQKPVVQNDHPKVFVSILPQKYFVDKICGDLVDVFVMVLPGSSPHTYEPRPSQMKELSKASAYFSIGVEFENAWLPKFAQISKSMRIIHSDSLVQKAPADSSETAEMSGNKISNSNFGLDPHIWLAPRNAAQITRNIYGALCQIDPVHSEVFTRNYLAFEKEISHTHDTICALLRCDSKTSAEKNFMVFHPSWAYFAREFGLRQLAIEIEGKEPSPRQLESVFTQARKNGVRAIFVQPQFSRQSAQTIARQLNAQVLVADDLAYNWSENLLSIAQAIAKN